MAPIRGPLFLLMYFLALPALAAEKQIWECRTEHPGAQAILHLVEWGSRSYVKFSHVRFGAKYEHDADEDHHGWYWSNEGSGYYRYALVLHDDGKAWFHDFSETDEDGLSAPLDYFLCDKNE